MNKQKVLIVDDNPGNIKLAADTLNALDISIVFATNGFKAIEIVKEQLIDLILMDITMPKMDGFETVKMMDTKIPIIYVTALDDKQSVLKAFGNGGVDYISKPFYPEELLARVSTHLNLNKLNKNLLEEVQLKNKELQESMFIDHATGTHNTAQLYVDLLKLKKTVGVMFHIKKIQQYEIAFGLENVEHLLENFINYLKTKCDLTITIYHITYSDFICLFETNDIKMIEECCLEVLEDLKDHIFTILETPIHLNTTISVAFGKEKQLIQHLRIAQQEALNKNLNYYFYDQEGMDIIKEQTKNLYWLDFLQNSIKNDTLIPFFQPIVDTFSGEVVKYECLARIKEKDRIIAPYFFIDAAKQLGIITQITKIIIEKSCKMFANTSMKFSINITKDDLMEAYLIDMLETMCQTHHLIKEQITLEVLEEISVFGSNRVVDELLKLKALGYKIALDDFGSENASFSRMLDLKVDIVKIDGMFIKNIDTHLNSRLIVEGITYMAKLFNYDVVAEFVHKKEIVDILKELGIDYSQGYYFSEPTEMPSFKM